jgi:hypothetical protein
MAKSPDEMANTMIVNMKEKRVQGSIWVSITLGR